MWIVYLDVNGGEYTVEVGRFTDRDTAVMIAFMMMSVPYRKLEDITIEEKVKE